MRKVRLGRELEAAVTEDVTSEERIALSKVSEMYAAGEEALHSGRDGAAAGLFLRAEEALVAWRAGNTERRKVRETKTIVLLGGAEMEMIWCPPGSFMMGSPETEEGRFVDEIQHRVTLTKGFWLGKTPVTQRQWMSVMGNNPSYFKGDDLPLENVSWDECQEFCRKAGLALPTEAQWEYACRAGSTGPYAGTGRLEEMGWFAWNSDDGKLFAFRKTHPVGHLEANDWGLNDMHGNVWEWCADWYGAYLSDATTDPTGPLSGSHRVSRGGSWGDDAKYCRSAIRSGLVPGYRDRHLGLRVALPLVQ